MTAFLAEYWLEALLAVSGAVTVVGLLVNQIKLRIWLQNTNASQVYYTENGKLFVAIQKYLQDEIVECVKTDEFLRFMNEDIHPRFKAIKEDIHDLKERFNNLDKPSNDKALAELKTQVLKKTAQQNKGGKSFQKKLIAGSKLKKANGARHAHR